MATASKIDSLSYKELAELQQQIAQQMSARRESEISTIVEDLKKRCDEMNIPLDEIVKRLTRRVTPAPSRGTAQAKYRDPATGNTWSGRGKRPAWLTKGLEEGKSLEDFTI